MINDKHQGILSTWNPKQSIGIIVQRQGSVLKKFFMHLSAVERIEPDIIAISLPVLFRIDENHPPKTAGRFWRAVDVEILLPIAVKLTNGGAK